MVRGGPQPLQLVNYTGSGSDDPGGIIVTILIGIAGGLLGGFIASSLGIGGGSNIVNIVVATLGAILLLVLYRIISKRRTV
jgi:uncharacterized membrane protein YeaQ/YmgE (transglycosylase-associated protein family)